MKCTFFGHSDAPGTILPVLRQNIKELIENNKEITFYVGTHGNFDSMVLEVLREFSSVYRNMRYYIVLAYMPGEKNSDIYNGLPTLLPDGIENVPKKFAISFRNDYMIKICDAVICYVTHSCGGAAQFTDKAEKKKKHIINLALNTK